MTVTFFGHRDTPCSVQPLLQSVLEELICQQHATNFLIGCEGAFDRMAIKTLQELQTRYPEIRYTIVYAYYPDQNLFDAPFDCTLFPDELANVPRKFAIDRRNTFLVKRADMLITYVRYHTGGAAKFQKLAEKSGKRVLNLAETY